MESKGKSDKNLNKAYKNGKWGWILYVIVPAILLIAFLILLMDCFEENNEITLATNIPSNKWTRTMNFSFFTTITLKRSDNLATPTEEPIVETPLTCTDGRNNYCFLHCTGDMGPLLNEYLNNHHRKCDGQLAVMLENCRFPEHKIMPHLFDGSYKLQNLIITNCDFEYIEEDTFKQSAFTNLTSLSFISNKIEDLTNETFIGLRLLKVFKMDNNETTFKGDHFLQPLARTLEILELKQRSKSNHFDPKIWFGNAEFPKLLTVDLSENYFPYILGNETFYKLKSVERLNLQKCEITYLEAGTFNAVAPTLQYLDLRNNNLMFLNVDFLAAISVQVFRLLLTENPWNCTCPNYELILAVQRGSFIYNESPKCESPEEWNNISMGSVSIICLETTVEPTITEQTTKETETTTELPIASTTTGYSSTESNTTATRTSQTETTSPFSSTKTSLETTVEPTITEGTTDDTDTSELPITTTTTGYTVTDRTTTTFTSTQSSTGTTDYPDTVVWITCGKNETTSSSYILDSKIVFTVETVSETSVNLSITGPQMHLTLLFFNNNYSGRQYCDQNCRVTDLPPLEAYTFCIIPNGKKGCSAFQCLSHTIIPQSKEKALPKESNNTLFWTLFAFGIPISILIGGVVVYFLLRWRPVWLRGNKRLVRASPASHAVFLYGKPRRDNETADSSRDRVCQQNFQVNESPSCSSAYLNQIAHSQPKLAGRRPVEVPSSPELSAFYEKID